MKPYCSCSNSIPTVPRLSGMSLKPSTGSEPHGSDMQPGPWSGGAFHSSSQHLQQGQDAEAQHPASREWEQGKLDPYNPAHPSQGQHSPEQREAHAEPSSRNTNFTVHLHHSLMQRPLPCCSSPARLSPTFSSSFPAHFLMHPQMHTSSPTETLPELIRGWESFQHKPPTMREGQAASRAEPQQQPSFPPFPQCQPGALHRVAPTEERVTHCRVTLLLWMAGKSSG